MHTSESDVDTFVIISYQLLNMMRIKRDINQQTNWKQLNFILSNLNNFQYLEIVDRVREIKWVKIPIY